MNKRIFVCTLVLLIAVPVVMLGQPTAPCSQDNWNTLTKDPTPLPCGQTLDQQRETIYLQNMRIRGQRFFTAEATSSHAPSNIVAGENVTSCGSAQGRVVIDREYTGYKPWQANLSVNAGDTVAVLTSGDGNELTPGKSRFYVAENSGTTGSSAPPWAPQAGVSVEDNGIQWEETGYAGTMYWQPGYFLSVDAMARPYPPNGYIYRVVSKSTQGSIGNSEPCWFQNLDYSAATFGSFSDGELNWGIDWNHMIVKPWQPGEVIDPNELHNQQILRQAPSPYSSELLYCIVAGTTSTDGGEDWDPPCGTNITDGTVTWGIVQCGNNNSLKPATTVYNQSSSYSIGDVGVMPSSLAMSEWLSCSSSGCVNGDNHSATARSQMLDRGIFAEMVVGTQFQTNSSAPSWPTTIGGQVQDGDNGALTWQNVGQDAADVDFRATGKIKLEPGFRAVNGCYLHAYIKPKVVTCLDENWRSYGVQSNAFNDGRFACYWPSEFGSSNPGLVSLERDPFTPNDTNKKLLHLRTGSGTSLSGIASCEIPWNGGDGSVSFAHSYGRFDCRMKINSKEPGAHGSFWIWGDYTTNSTAYPNLGGTSDADEFDIEERADWYDPSTGCVCSGYTDQANHSWRQLSEGGHTSAGGQNFYGSDLGTDFHTYSLEWGHGTETYLIDDMVVTRLPRNHGFNWATNARGGPAYILLDNRTDICLSPQTSCREAHPQTCTNWDCSDEIVDYIKVYNFQGFENCISQVCTSSTQPSNQSSKSVDGSNLTQLVSPDIDIKIVPNPSNGIDVIAEIQLGSNDEIRNVSISVYDVLGRRVSLPFSGQVKGQLIKSLDLYQTLAAGNYNCVFVFEGAGDPLTITKPLQIMK